MCADTSVRELQVKKKGEKKGTPVYVCGAVRPHPASSYKDSHRSVWHSLKIRLWLLALWPHGLDIHITKNVWEDVLQILLLLNKRVGTLKNVWVAPAQLRQRQEAWEEKINGGNLRELK